MKRVRNRELGVCIFCDSFVFLGDDIYNMALDRPMRLTLPAHKDCYNKWRNSGDLNLFLQNNLLEYLQKYYDYEEEYGEKTKSHKTKSINE